ncbi:MAG TPA: hypothetical protein VNF04_10065, partial [Stellaceae bacterium]|nr:hypothetical protein [Stellaceae bacterium]
AAVTCLGLGYRNTARAHEAGSLRRRIGEGVAIVRGDKRLIGTLVITVIFNVFAWPFTSMIPVIGQDHLGLGPGGIGVLASMDGLGAFAGAIGIALGATPARYARLYLGGTAGYLALLPIFAFVSAPLLAGCTLLMTGVASAAFTIMQSTLIYLLAPQETRSRVFGVLSVCIGMGPIGFVHLGLLADAIGPSAAVATVAVEGMIALALTFRYWRFVLRAAAAA